VWRWGLGVNGRGQHRRPHSGDKDLQAALRVGELGSADPEMRRERVPQMSDPIPALTRALGWSGGEVEGQWIVLSSQGA
jgi:hypothetical protein